MNARDPHALPAETTPTTRDRLCLLSEAPLRPRKPLDLGRFEECARNQLDLFWQGVSP